MIRAYRGSEVLCRSTKCSLPASCFYQSCVRAGEAKQMKGRTQQTNFWWDQQGRTWRELCVICFYSAGPPSNISPQIGEQEKAKVVKSSTVIFVVNGICCSSLGKLHSFHRKKSVHCSVSTVFLWEVQMECLQSDQLAPVPEMAN